MMPAVGDGLRRPVSPLLAGRADELALLLAAFEDVAGPGAGEHGLVHLLGGEAGGGKTRLVRELTARVADRAHVLRGGCVEASGAGLPYAPFVTALNAHTATVPVDELRDLLGEGVLQELARLVPSLGVAAPSDPELGRSRLFAAVLDLLTLTAAGDRPVLLVVEDLHWADAATRDLLAYLVREVPRRVHLVATYRDTERGEGHPLLPLLAELARSDGVTRVPVVRLDEAGTADQLEGILGRIPDPALVRTVHERGGGVPLFTEALVTADGRLRSEVPASLRDLTLAAVRTLPRESRDLLAAAATGGDRVSHRLLCRVTGLDDVGVTDAVRAAVAAQVLEGDGDGYVFRHQLIGEAVRDGVLRATGSGCTAPTPRRSPSSRSSRTARRCAPGWPTTGTARARPNGRSRPPGRPRPAPGRPAGSARTGTSGCGCSSWWWRSGTGHRRRAAGTGTDLAGVLAQAANAACWCAEPARGLRLIEEAMRVVPAPVPAERRAAMLLERSSFRDQSMAAGCLDDLRDAVRVAPEASLVRVEALGQLARALLARDLVDEARSHLAVMRAAVAAAGSAGYALEAEIVSAMADAPGGSMPWWPES